MGSSATGIWRSDIGVPDDGLGSLGDYYLDLDSSKVYEKQTLPAQPVFRSQASSTGLTCDKPTDLEVGDVLYAFVQAYSNTPSPPAGWTVLPEYSVTGGFGANWDFRVFKRVVDGSEGANFNFGSDSTGVVVIVAYSGNVSEDATGVISSNYIATTTIPAPSVTTVTEYALLLCATMGDNVSANYITPPVGYTERIEKFNPSGGGSISVSDKIQEVPGASGTVSPTPTGNFWGRSLHLALKGTSAAEGYVEIGVLPENASQLSFTPTGSIAATDVQGAIEEVVADLPTAATGIWVPGEGDPSVEIGGIGDFYLNTLNGEVWLKELISDPPNFGAVGAVANTNNSPSTTVPHPTGIQAGDLLVLVVTAWAGSQPVVNTPSGWTRIVDRLSFYTGNGGAAYVYIKEATGFETGSVAISAGGNAYWSSAMVRIEDVNENFAEVINAIAVGTVPHSTTPSTPSIDTTEPGCLIVSYVVNYSANNVPTPPSGMTFRFHHHFSGTFQHGHWADAVQSIAGATGTKQWTLESTSGANQGVLTFAISGLGGTPTWVNLGRFLPATASEMPFVPSGTIAATDIQAAIEEVASEAVVPKVVQLKITDDITDLTTGDGKFIFVVDPSLNGKNLIDADAFLSTGSSSGTPTIQIRNITQAADMLSTAITIDVSELTSYSAAVPPVIDTGNDDVATGDLISIDVDVSGTGAKGLGVVLTFA